MVISTTTMNTERRLARVAPDCSVGTTIMTITEERLDTASRNSSVDTNTMMRKTEMRAQVIRHSLAALNTRNK